MTIRDVAEQSGVSVSTVSRVLNGHPDVSPRVRERVTEVVRRLHYVPNSSARNLVRTRADAVGVVVRGAENPFFTPVLAAVEGALEQAGCAMVLRQIRAGEDELMAGAVLTGSRRLKGLIFMGGCFDYTPEQTAVLGVPFVCCTYTNGFGTLDRGAYSSVSIDDRGEAQRAVRYLIQRGHRRVAILLDSTHDRSVSQLRYSGYRMALAEAGIPLDEDLVAETGEFTMAAAYARTCRLLESGAPFTAMFAVADAMAVAAMKALREAGRRIPEDCSVIAIDGIELSLYTFPTLTTLVQPQAALGAQAVQILLEMTEGRWNSRHVRLEADLRPGGTVAEWAPK